MIFDSYHLTVELVTAGLKDKRKSKGRQWVDAFDSWDEDKGEEEGEEDDEDPLVTSCLVSAIQLLLLDTSFDLLIKMVYKLDDVMGALRNAANFHPLLASLLRLANVAVAQHLVRTLYNMFSLIMTSGSGRKAGRRASEQAEKQTICEHLIMAYLSSEQFLSTRSDWRLYIQYLSVGLRMTRLVSGWVANKCMVNALMERVKTVVS